MLTLSQRKDQSTTITHVGTGEQIRIKVERITKHYVRINFIDSEHLFDIVRDDAKAKEPKHVRD